MARVKEGVAVVDGRKGAWVVAVIAVAVGCAPRAGSDGGESAAVTVTDAYAAEPVSREVGAAYLTVHNTSRIPDTLVAARSPVAAMVHLHRMGGIGASQMKTQDEAEVPAAGRLQLRPGGLHLMLMGLASVPRAGDTIELTLEFRRAGAVTVQIPVLSYLEVGERAAVGAELGGR